MMELLPWLAVLGLGALHGLSPASGWTLAAGCALQAGGSAGAWRALLPIALGHAGSAALVALAAGNALPLDRTLARQVAGVVLVGMALLQPASRLSRPCLFHLRRRPGIHRGRGTHRGAARPLGASIGLCVWSGLMATAHGAGLMLVPALGPLCLTGRAADALLPAVAALALHLAAMLLTAGLLATGLCRGAARWPALAASKLPRHACSAALAVTGLALIARP